LIIYKRRKIENLAILSISDNMILLYPSFMFFHCSQTVLKTEFKTVKNRAGIVKTLPESIKFDDVLLMC